ncbi:hypothetical protein [Myroides sp. LoEW2-1]|uniref:hypothetical protein n=1 Tax=Myroides sp. LoEW2-1 TaxID=2683192 RepID=UPI00132605A8|nr:hypothetical protein [Myroides sp. LoEW2-1]MVX34528.1 hypothetical protein [Myroides sp. LoEW2-1]
MNYLLNIPNRKNYLVAFTFIVSMVAAAVLFKDREIVLPEIAALTIGLWVFQEKAWLRQPEKVFILPSITAFVGFSINMLEIPYVVKIVGILFFMLILMKVINYSLPPALATGFLPIVTNATHWSFVYAIIATTFILMIGIYLFKLNKNIDRNSKVNTTAMTVYAGIVLSTILIALLFGKEKYVVIPPIAVVLYETLHMKQYTIKMVVKQIAVLSLSISIGVVLYLCISNWIVITILMLLSIYFLLELFQMKMPPAYAFPFLVFIFSKEQVINLPWLTVLLSSFSLFIALAYHRYYLSKKIVQLD